MKKFSHCLALVTILGSAAMMGASAESAFGNPQVAAQQQAALDLPATDDQQTIGLRHAVRVPTPADISPAGQSGPTVQSSIVPPLEISADEAREWVADAGYSDVSELTLAKTSDGAPVYRGTAMADGEVYAVIVDSWGNIAGWQ